MEQAMILDIVCPVLATDSAIYFLVGRAYNFRNREMWAIWFQFGALLGVAILSERVRLGVMWLCAIAGACVVGVVILAELLGACHEHVDLPGNMDLILESEWAAFAGLGVLAFLHWLLGPRVERLLDALTGKSHERKDRLSDIRSVDTEIPRRPKDFDPRKYFTRRHT